MRERLRWKVAHLLDRSDRWCWANLVTWALGRHPLSEAQETSVCARDVSANGSCYCGKFQREVSP